MKDYLLPSIFFSKLKATEISQLAGYYPVCLTLALALTLALTS